MNSSLEDGGGLGILRFRVHPSSYSHCELGWRLELEMYLMRDCRPGRRGGDMEGAGECAPG